MCDEHDDDQEPKSTLPEFKPGSTIYCQVGYQILNNNLPWVDILAETLALGDKNIGQIASELQTSINMLKTLVNGNDCHLNFKQGARLLRLHHEAKIRAGRD